MLKLETPQVERNISTCLKEQELSYFNQIYLLLFRVILFNMPHTSFVECLFFQLVIYLHVKNFLVILLSMNILELLVVYDLSQPENKGDRNLILKPLNASFLATFMVRRPTRSIILELKDFLYLEMFTLFNITFHTTTKHLLVLYFSNSTYIYSSLAYWFLPYSFSFSFWYFSK